MGLGISAAPLPSALAGGCTGEPVITAEAFGAGVAPQPLPGSLADGDFFITGASRGDFIGDGRDESTVWLFDFGGDPDLGDFNALVTVLGAAPLTLTLSPMSEGNSNDRVRIAGAGPGWVGGGVYGAVAVGATETVTIDLLDWYTSDELLTELALNSGRFLPAIYRDDAIVSYAKLELQPSCDADGDGLQTAMDNCVNVANAGQVDVDADGFGNACDADFNNDCVINAADLAVMRSAFFSDTPLADLNEDGIVNSADLGILKSAFFGTPGPSGTPNICAP